MKQLRTLAVVVLLLGMAFGQNKVRDQNTLLFTVTGVTLPMLDSIGTQYNQWELVMTGGPATLTVTITGCMRGGTCSATLATSSGTANQILNTTGVYDYYNVAAAWTGGTSPTVTVNRTATIALNGGGGSGVTGTLSTNKVAKGTAAHVIGDSLATDDGTTLTYTGNGGIVAKSITLNGTAAPIPCTEVAAPSTPNATFMSFWCDSTDHAFHAMNSSGTTQTAVVPTTPVTGKYVTGIGNTGAVNTSQANFLVCSTMAGSTIPGTGSAATIYTCSIPANTMKAATGIQADAYFRCSTCAATAATWIFNYGATTLTSASDSGTLTTISHATLHVFNNAGVTNAQTVVEDLLFHGTAGVAPGAPATAAENSTAPVTLTFQFNAASDHTITPILFTVQAISN